MKASQRRDRLNLDQERLADEPIDHQQRVGRIDAIRKHLRELAQPELHELRDVLRMNEVGRELDYVRPSGARGVERGPNVREDLHALRVEVLLTDDVALLVARKLPRYEQELRRLNARHL